MALLRRFTMIAFSTVLTLTLTRADSPSSQPQNILVITESSTRQSHSHFLQTLTDLKKDVVYVPPTTKHIPLREDGLYKYDAIILLAPQASLQSSLPISTITDFLEAGMFLYIAAASSYSGYTVQVAECIGVDLLRAVMVDHQNAHPTLDDRTHTYINAGPIASSLHLFGQAAHMRGDIVFRGPGASLFRDNELVDAVIRGASSSYAADGKPLTKAPRVSGHAAVLAAALSTRAAGRAVYFGSLDALSDNAFAAAGERHALAMTNLLAWALGARGVLRVSNVRHSRLDGGARSDSAYRVKDVLSFALDAHVWDAFATEWAPFAADDMQLELTMLNPWVRTQLRSYGNGTFAATVLVPDQIGVYKFSVQYFRPGISHISLQTIVPVRPFLHNEYERFIPMAAPYYVASFSMLFGVIFLGLTAMFGHDSEQDHEKCE